jgi:cytoskeletal protein CcmA (bactofilin family)
MQTDTPQPHEEYIMARTTFSGPVKSDNGFEGNITGTVTGAVAATTLSASGVASLTNAANVLVIPTTDPGVAGAIWFDTPDLKISTGA